MPHVTVPQSISYKESVVYSCSPAPSNRLNYACLQLPHYFQLILDEHLRLGEETIDLKEAVSVSTEWEPAFNIQLLVDTLGHVGVLEAD